MGHPSAVRCQGWGMEQGLLLGSALGFLTRAGSQTEQTYSGKKRQHRCSGMSVPLYFSGDNCYGSVTP